MTDREIYFFMQKIPGIGNKTIAGLLQEFKGLKAIYEANEEELKKVLGPFQVRNFLRIRSDSAPDLELSKLKEKGIFYTSLADADYPEALRKIPEPPYGLFFKGKLPDKNKKCVAVIGARDNSGYGANMTKQYCEILVEAGFEIVSGMARGIDGIAHRAAMEAGGDTYGVLGCGIDICYPRQNRELYDRMIYQGGVISEYPPGTQPMPGLFPLRNRIISGLSSVLLVMEARYRSGTLITVDAALEQGKEVMALPGRVNDALSQGCNMLIAQGAGALKEPEEFRDELYSLLGIKEKNTEVQQVFLPKERQIFDLLEDTPLSLNEIWERLQKKRGERVETQVESLSELSALLMELCIKKKIEFKQGCYSKN